MQLAGAVKVVVRGPALDILGRSSLHLAFALTILLIVFTIGSLRDVNCGRRKLQAGEVRCSEGRGCGKNVEIFLFFSFQFDGDNYPSKQQDCIFRVADLASNAFDLHTFNADGPTSYAPNVAFRLRHN